MNSLTRIMSYDKSVNQENCNCEKCVSKIKNISVEIENKSNMELGEVVQIYIKDMDSTYATTNGKLCGFARVNVPAGEKVNVAVPMDKDTFTVVNDAGQRLVDGKKFTVSVGFGQADARTKALTGKEAVVFAVEG